MSDVLTYLQGDAAGPKRDLIARYYYEVAQGDPNSSPVALAVLLEASAEQFAKTPEELSRITADFRQLLAEGRGLEARIRERVELSNAGVVASLKEEGNRIASNLRIASDQHAEIVSKGQLMVVMIQQLFDQGQTLLAELRLIRTELKTNDESTRKIAEANENTKTAVQTIKEIVISLTHTSVWNWLTIGLGMGFVLTSIATQLAWYWALLLFAIVISLFQLAAGGSWADAKKEAEKVKLADPRK
jgi:hypothetical protein